MEKFEHPPSGRLCQGLVLSGVSQLQRVIPDEGLNQVRLIVHPFCVVISQDCDLEQDIVKREAGNPGSLPNVLMCMAIQIVDFKNEVPQGSDIWKRVRANSDERFHCIEAVPPNLDAQGKGVTELGMDFKRYFTVETDDLYEQLKAGGALRRAKLITPYAEQVSLRFANYLSRIGLPEDFSIYI